MRKIISLNVNETLTFELESHEGGGYCWTIVTNDESVAKVKLKKQMPTRKVTDIPLGKSFPTLVEIKAVAPGKTTVLLEEKRSWEKDKSLNVCKAYITVQ